MEEHELTVRLLDNDGTPAYRGMCSCGNFESTLCGRVALIGEEFDEHIQDELNEPLEISDEIPEDDSPETDWDEWEHALSPSVHSIRD